MSTNVTLSQTEENIVINIHNIETITNNQEKDIIQDKTENFTNSEVILDAVVFINKDDLMKIKWTQWNGLNENDIENSMCTTLQTIEIPIINATNEQFVETI